MKILDRYVLRQFAVAYGICLTTVLGLYILLDSFNRIGGFLAEEESFPAAAARYYGAFVPVYFYQLAPFITLMAAMFSVSRMNRNNELLPMKACGISVLRALSPVFVAAAALSGAIVLDQEVILPGLSRRLAAYGVLGSVKATDLLHPGAIPDRFGSLLHMRSYDAGAQRMDGPIFTTYHPSGLRRSVFLAREARWVRARGEGADGKGGHGQWLLSEGMEQLFDERGLPIYEPGGGALKVRRFEDAAEALPTNLQPIDIESLDRELVFLTFRELDAQYRRQPFAAHLRVQLHQRLAFPCANIVLVFLGLPFVLGEERRSVWLGLLICLAICGGFFISTFLLADLGRKGMLSPVLAAWLPILFFGTLGGMLFDSVRS